MTMHPYPPLHPGTPAPPTGSPCRMRVEPGGAELAVGLTLVKTGYGNALIQGCIYRTLYSDYRLALHYVNRLARNSSLAGNITKIGHGNFTRPCFKVYELHDVWHQCMSAKVAKPLK